MNLHFATQNGWPVMIVHAVRATRRFFAWVSERAILGVPLDLPLRFVLIGSLYVALRRWTTRGRAAAIAAGLLVAKEFLDVFAHLDLLSPRSPDWGDAADVASGLLGIGAAELIIRAVSRLGAGRLDGGGG